MALEHSGTSRLTAEQRDRVLDLAARLQAQHDATVEVDELARFAGEAGIDPQFVHQAAARVVGSPVAAPERTPPTIDGSALLLGLGAIALSSYAVHVFRSGNPFVSSFSTLILGALLGFVGFFMGTRRMPLFVPPLAAFLVLFAANYFFAASFVPDAFGFRFQIALSMSVFGTVAVLAGAALARVPREAR